MRELLVGMAAIGFMTALVASSIRSIPPQYAEHVAITEAPFGLPQDAQDVSFCQDVRGTIAYEFTIDRSAFCEWVERGIGSIESNSSDARLEPITNAVTITRFYRLSQELTGPNSITVTDGLRYRWSHEDRGVYAVFDATTNRAYYYAHFH